jgi:subtilisin family serine protease
MSRRRWVPAAMAAALVPPLLVIGAAGPSQAAPVQVGKYRVVQNPQQVGQVSATKSPTSRLAQTDKSLLNRKDSAPVSIAVKLAYDSTATYEGGLAGYAATSPSVTGKALSHSAAEVRYEGHIADIENSFLGNLKKRVPNAKVGQHLRTVYGGLALTVPANKVNDVLSIPGVVAVQKDSVSQPQTDSSPAFIGATQLYPKLGGTANAGKGVIFGSLDTGVWPEHPSFADNGNLGTPPATADGHARACDFGDNPLTPAADVFQCNNKLIGGQPFLATYMAVNPANPEVYTTARDSNGHGSHTSSTAVGDPVASAKIFNVERGPINGIAPGAWLMVYKVCGLLGCYSTDSAAAVGQALKDGVNVINFSIGGGATPFTDVVELAFLDAYAAGTFVAASAGNSGPGASTSDHLAPWVTTVAASTQKREFDSTLTVTSSDGASATFVGASITAGAGPLPVVLASAAPYSDIFCGHPAPPGTFTGKIVACQRGGTVNGEAIGRAQKGFNLAQGGAAGMILYNQPLADTETDNHFLPAVHLADGTAFLAFVNGHPGVTASFTTGQKVNGQGDVMAAFSSRGPGGNFIKPDISAPGVQILGANSPTPDEVAGGPAGQYYQAIAGTSMASPHIAGSAVLEKALHPSWTPGQIKSALMTTATTAVVKEDLTTPADPFDFGSGRVQVNLAANPGLTFDETAARMAALGNDPVQAVQLNLASVNAPVMPGTLTAVRTATNVTNKTQSYKVQTTAPKGASITVSPSSFSVAPGKSVKLSITIKSSAPEAQYFGQVRLVPQKGGLPTLHLPVAYITKQGDVKMTQTCDRTEAHLLQTTTCTVSAQNTSFIDTTADFATSTTLNLPIIGTSGASQTSLFKAQKKGATLVGAKPGTPSIAPAAGTANGYVPLDLFGITPTAVGDEQFVKFNTPAYKYNGVTYTGVSIDSNGYVVPGTDATAEDNDCCTVPPIPNPARPNNVLAPYWTDLNGGGAPGVYIAVLSDDAGNSWIVIEWRVFVFGTNILRPFQLWLGEGATQDITFAYDPTNPPVDPNGQPYNIGAENVNGTGGQGLPAGTLPTDDIRVTSTDPVPGATVSYTVTTLAILPGDGKVTTTMDTPAVPGTTVVSNTIKVSLHH